MQLALQADPGRQFRSQQCQRLAHHLLDVHGHALARRSATERQDAIDQSAASFARRDHVIQISPQAAALFSFAKPAFAEAEDGPEDVVEVVRDPACERTHRLEVLGLAQSAFKPPQFLLLALAIRDVADRAHHSVGHTLRVPQGASALMQPTLAGRQQDPQFDVVHHCEASDVRVHGRTLSSNVFVVIPHELLPLLAAAPDLSRRDTQQFLGALRNVDSLRLEIPIEDAFVRTSERQCVALLRCAHFLFSTRSRGDIRRRYGHAQQSAGSVTHMEDRDMHPPHFAPANDARVELQPLDVVAYPLLFQQSNDPCTIIRMKREEVEHLLPLRNAQFRRQPPLLEQSGRRVERVLVGDPMRVAIGRRLDRQRIAFIGLFAFRVLPLEPGVQVGVLQRDRSLR